MAMTFDERRRAHRVQFEKPLDAKIMAIDGTWCHECQLLDVSESGARITLASPAAGLMEFFLVLSSFGIPVYRRCKRAWVDGPQMGVAFQKGAAIEKRLTMRGHRADLA
jgi:PilZ domain